MVHFADPVHVRRDRPIVLKKHEGPGEPEGYDGNYPPKETWEPEQPEPTRETSLDDFSPEENPEQIP